MEPVPVTVSISQLTDNDKDGNLKKKTWKIRISSRKMSAGPVQFLH